jgi:hypothetical protein
MNAKLFGGSAAEVELSLNTSIPVGGTNIVQLTYGTIGLVSALSGPIVMLHGLYHTMPNTFRSIYSACAYITCMRLLIADLVVISRLVLPTYPA